MAGFLRGRSKLDRASWTVSQLTNYIRELFEIDLRLQDVEVTGEISNFTRARSGHLYFTLKDNQAQLKCVMWRSAAEQLLFFPENGDAVIARGRISVYEASGVYQLYAEQLVQEGRGDLAVAFEQLKQRLEQEGLFEPEHKQPIPVFPRKIGIVTSADAAALRDILHVLQRRCPLVSVLIAPTLVQGDLAPTQIVRALQWLDGRSDIDTIIIARGGGSMEDLWAFNDENVARAVFAAQHPIISGVGHEVDFTITDFVADLRAPTPSAAAEVAVPDLAEIRPLLNGLQMQLLTEMQARLVAGKREVDTLSRALTHLSPRLRLDNNRQKVDMLTARLERALGKRLDRWQGQVTVAAARLTTVSPLATLSRGYAIVRDENGRIIRTIQQINTDDKLSVQVADGTFEAAVME